MREMKDAPFDGTHVLLKLTRGWVEAWFDPSEPAWICADDTFQIEVELYGDGVYLGSGEEQGWLPLDVLDRAEHAVDLVDGLDSAMEKAFTEETVKRFSGELRKVIDEEVERAEWYLRDECAGNLLWWIRDETRRAVDAIIAGDEDGLRRHLGLGSFDGRDRPTGGSYSSYEPRPIELRRRMLEAHADMFVSEVIADYRARDAAMEQEIAALRLRTSRLMEND